MNNGMFPLLAHKADIQTPAINVRKCRDLLQDRWCAERLRCTSGCSSRSCLLQEGRCAERLRYALILANW